MDGPGFGRFVASSDGATPVGINVAVGAAVIIVATFLAAQVPVVDGRWAQLVMAVAVGVFAAVTVDSAAVALLLVPTWMLMNGFLVNRSGDLSWHGTPDVHRFLLLVGAGSLGLAFGMSVARMRDLQERCRLGAVVEAMSTEFESTEFDEEKHRA